MPSRIDSLLLDFRLTSQPSLEVVAGALVSAVAKDTTVHLVKVFERGSKGQKRSECAVFEAKEQDITALVKVYEAQSASERTLVSVTIELPHETLTEIQTKFDERYEEALREEMLKSLESFNVEQSMSYPHIKRCITSSPYLLTSDERILEYSYKEVLFSQRSDYQLVEIVDTLDYGRLLILDGMTNLAESDTKAYTHSLMNLPKEDYKNKEVLILGGGDGGLIQELFALDNPPAFVTMIDIDEVVMTACNEFMPSVCGEYLRKDNREGPRHKIITGCAIEFMKNALRDNKQYDYIFGDLTDTPVSTSARSKSLWDFLAGILSMGVQLLKPNTGKYMTHCNGKNAVTAIAQYEKALTELADGKCTFERSECFVPSFMETWMFYRIRRHS